MLYDIVTTYGCDTTQVARARTWIQRVLAERLPERTRADVVDDAALIVSELLTNAIRAGCAVVRVGLALERDCIRLGVSDDAPGQPAVRETQPTDVAGRGLPIVASLASDWGVVRTTSPPEGCKEVWATLPIH
jgi:anti-sigma regulatory factor (Ser/Thr protein kinase)